MCILDDSSFSGSSSDDDSGLLEDLMDQAHTPYVDKQQSIGTINLPQGPADISVKPVDGPLQPKLLKFPQTLSGKNYKGFNKDFYSMFSWLEYSISENCAYCFCCRHFQDNSGTLHETTFTEKGFRNWKHAGGSTGAFSKYQRLDLHKIFSVAWEDFKRQKDASVLSILSESHAKLVQENRYYLTAVIIVLRLTALQQISKRGHHQENGKTESNVCEMLKLIAEYDLIIKSRIENGPKNTKYLHHDIQNEFFTIMASTIRNQIANEINKSGSYALIVYETKDISKTVQLSFVLRYIFEGEINKEFLGFKSAVGLDAKLFLNSILQVLEMSGIPIASCIAQCYDGVSVNDIQSRFRALVPSAVYVHCHAHKLNLVIVDCVKNVKPAAQFISLLERIYVFISGSAVHSHFKELQAQKSHQKVIALKNISDTRWTCQYVSCHAIHLTFGMIIQTLNHFRADTNADRQFQAKSMVSLISASFVVMLILFGNVLLRLMTISKLQQSSTLDLLAAKHLITDVLDDFVQERENPEADASMWNTIVREASAIIDANDLEGKNQSAEEKLPKKPSVFGCNGEHW